MKLTDEQHKNLMSHADDMDACGWKDDARALRALLAAHNSRAPVHPQGVMGIPPYTSPGHGEARAMGLTYNTLQPQPMTDVAREVLTRWRSARTEPPKMDASPHYSITVLGVVDDPRYHNNDDDHAFVDVVGYWPALNKWTVTHSCVRDDTAEDVEVKVTWWMPLPEAP